MGGDYPIRLQSMTSTDTRDVKATLEQVLRIIRAGADLVRISTPTLKDVEAFAEIKKQLRDKGYNTPLIADIHFNPKVAEAAAKVAEKIRINPGNYSDRGYNEQEPNAYKNELEKIHERIRPLLHICKEYGTVIRVGSNSGSLSQRILSRYGNTPRGMVESALEFVDICEQEGFYLISKFELLGVIEVI